MSSWSTPPRWRSRPTRAIEKIYYRHSGFPGGLKEETFESLLARRPEQVIERAVKGMLPKNKLGRKMSSKLKVYAGPIIPTRLSSRRCGSSPSERLSPDDQTTRSGNRPTQGLGRPRPTP
jgi:hypothetical protein